jgi:hypothetical protein
MENKQSNENINSNIYLIISELINLKKVKKIELAQYLDVARNTLDDYLSGKTFKR